MKNVFRFKVIKMWMKRFFIFSMIKFIIDIIAGEKVNTKYLMTKFFKLFEKFGSYIALIACY